MNEEVDIEAAIERVKAGALEDYEVVVKAYQRQLRNWLAGLCPPGVDSDEIAHGALVVAFRQLHQYRLGSNFYGWLRVIARNLLLAELKRYRRQQKHLQSYTEEVLAEGLAEAAEEDSGVNWGAALQSCQEQLSTDSQFLVRARYQGQVRLELVARQMGKSVSAIKFQLFTIRKKLLKCLKIKMAEGLLSEN